jgi:methanogenic corrinoid protein MtbC1
MSKLSEAMKELEEERVFELVDEMLKEGVSPVQIVNECNEGLAAIGQLFAENYYFLTDGSLNCISCMFRTSHVIKIVDNAND